MDKKKQEDGKIKRCLTRVYSRITGYYEAIIQYNPGKKEEFKDRTTYNFTPKKRKEYKDGDKEYPHIDRDGFK